MNEQRQKSLDTIFGGAAKAKQVESRPPLELIFKGKQPQPVVQQNPQTFTEQLTAPKETPGLPSQQMAETVETVKDFGKGAAKGAVETLQTVASPITNILERVSGQQLGFSDEQLEPQNSAEKVGKTTERVAEYFIPGGASTRATLLVKSLIEGLKGGAVTALQNKGDIEDTTTGAVVSALTPGVAKGVGKVAGVTKDILKRGASGLMGKGTQVLDQILENPKTALEAFGQDSVENLAKDATKLRQVAVDMSKAAQKQYETDLSQLPKRLGRMPSITTTKGTTKIKVDGKTYELSMQGVRSNLTKTLRDFGVEVNPKKGTFDFLESPFVGTEEATLKKVADVISRWKDTTPAGLDALAVKIGQFRRSGPEAAQLNTVIDTMKRGVRNYLGERIPAAKEMVEKYADVQDTLEALGKFAGTDKFIGGTTEAIDTGKKIQGLMKGDKPLEQELIKTTVPEGNDILTREAVRQTKEAMPASLNSIGDIVRTALNTVVPPEAIAKFAVRAKMKVEDLQQVIEYIKQSPPAVQGALIQILTSQDN